MSHECLYLSSRPGPLVSVSQATVINLTEPEGAIYLPSNSLYRGKALRFRLSGSIISTGNAFGTLRIGIGYSVQVITLGTLTAYYAYANLTPRVDGSIGATSFFYDWTMVCRNVGFGLTDWFCNAFCASETFVNNHSGASILNPVISVPVVSTSKHNNTGETFLSPIALCGTTGTVFAIQLQNYRVDSIA